MNKKAFSLIELSIVVIIVGIIIAAVTGASKLATNAKLNRVIAEVNIIHEAIKLFEVTYDDLPGDFPKAQSFFGTSGISNGNGDGHVEWYSETYDATDQLEKAGLLESNYSAYGKRIFPFYKNAGAWVMISLYYNSGKLGGLDHITELYNTTFVGKFSSPNYALFYPKEAYHIDKKIDDGLPKSGYVFFRIALDTTDAGCTNSSTNYYVASTSIACNLLFALH